VVGSALPKGDRALFLVEKCTELGAERLTPLHTERSVVSPSDSKVEKLRRSVIEACKHCGRDQLMEIDEPQGWRGFAEAKPHDAVGWLLHPSGESAENAAPDWIAIGPEGGMVLGDTEVESFPAARLADWFAFPETFYVWKQPPSLSRRSPRGENHGPTSFKEINGLLPMDWVEGA